MNDNEIAVKVTADGSQVASGIRPAKSEVQSFEPLLRELNSMFAGLAAEMKQTMGAGATATHAMAGEVRELVGELRKEKSAVDDVDQANRRAANSMSGVGSGIRNMIGGLIAGLSITAVTAFTMAMGDANEAIYLMSQRLGVTIGDVQTLKAMADTSGASIDDFATAMTRLDRVYAMAKEGGKTQAEAIRAIGLDATKSYTNMELLAAAMEKFSTMSDGPAKAALAMALFGKSGAELIPILSQNKEQIAAFKAELEAYGAINEQAVLSGNQLANALDTSDIAMKGVSNTMTQALAPVLTDSVIGMNELIRAFTDSYSSGGLAAQALSLVAEAVDIARFAFEQLIDVLIDAWNAVVEVCAAAKAAIDQTFGEDLGRKLSSASAWINLVKNTLIVFKDLAVIAIEVVRQALEKLVVALQVFGNIAQDVFTLNWGRIAADWQAGADRITQINLVAAARIKAAYDDANKASNAAAAGVAMNASPSKTPEPIALPKIGRNTDLDFAGTGRGGAASAKDTSPSVTQKWRTELADMLAAEANWGADEQAMALGFWTEKLDLVAKGSKEELEIRREVARLRLSIHKQTQADEVQSIRDRLAIETDASKTEIDLARLGLQEKLSAIAAADQAGAITGGRAIAMRSEINQQLSRLDQEEAEREYQLKLKAFDDQLAIEHLGVKARDEILRQKELLEADHLNRLALLHGQARLKEQQDENAAMLEQRQRYDSMFQPFAQSLAKMATLQRSFVGTVRDMYMSVVGIAQNAIANIVRNWLVGLATKTAAEKASHGASILMDAKKAAAGAWAAVVQIPIVGPILAPVAAAAAFAGVMAFSAEKGAGEVPYDGAQFTLHKEEMVLPASLANPLRSMLRAPANDPRTAANDPAGPTYETHLHLSAIDGRSARRFLFDNQDALAEVLGKAMRDGFRPGYA